MASFRVKNIEIYLSELFLFALIFLEKLTEEKVIICLFSTCFIHEMGHIFALNVANEKISKIKFTISGIIIVPENRLKKFGTEIFILLFGPFFNIISGLVILNFNREAGCFSLITGIFHLFPLQILDGGRILFNIFAIKSGLEKAEKQAILVNNISVLIIFTFLFVFQVKNIVLYVILALNVRKSGRFISKVAKTCQDLQK